MSLSDYCMCMKRNRHTQTHTHTHTHTLKVLRHMSLVRYRAELSNDNYIPKDNSKNSQDPRVEDNCRELIPSALLSTLIIDHSPEGF